MAKQTGLGAGLLVSDRDISGDVGAVNSISGGFTPIDVTSINQSAFQRLPGVRSGQISYSAYFNDSTGTGAHEQLSSLPTADRIVTYMHRTSAVGDSAASLVAKQINYDPTRAQDGSLTFTVDAQSNNTGLEWGKMLTAGVISSTSPDFSGTTLQQSTGATTAGGAAVLHVTVFDGTDATIKVQHSTSGSTWVDLLDFTEVTAVTSERVGLAAGSTVKGYIRAASTTASGYNEVQFAVNFIRGIS